MIKENILLGIAGIVLGIAIFIKYQAIAASLLPILLGIGLILFYKEENKIENRKDIKIKNLKK